MTILAQFKANTCWPDRLLITILVVLLPAVYVHFWSTHDAHPTTAEIRINGTVVQNIPLDQPGLYSFTGALGQSIIEIKNRQARFIESPCRGKQCIHMGWQSLGGSFAACLPNRITLAVKGHVQQLDGVNF